MLTRLSESLQPLQATMVRISLDLGLFEKLEQVGPYGKSIDELKKETGADPVLLCLLPSHSNSELSDANGLILTSARIMRYLGVTEVIDQLDRDHYAGTVVSKNLLSRELQAGVKHK